MLEAVRQRRSIRKYRPDAVEPEKLQQVLEAARLAPSWGNWQCVYWVVVTQQELRAQLSELSQGVPPYTVANPARKALAAAPVTLVACADPARSGRWNGMEYYLVDAGIALAHVTLQATELGLGTCIIGAFEEDKIKELLGIPREHRVVAMTPLGYPEKIPGPRPRKDLAELVRYI